MHISQKKSSRPSDSHIKMLESEESNQKNDQVCTHFSETGLSFTDEVQKVDLKRNQNLTLQPSFTCESSPNLVFGFHSDNYEVGTSATKVKFVLGYNSSAYQERLHRICYGDITRLKSKESVRIKSSSGDYLVESKDSHHHVASCSIFKSKVGQQSETDVPFCSKSLHLKFPKNFNIPTKEQLIKFSVFGSVDSSRTRVFWYAGSAQVAFFKEIDAVAAYQYAKRKVWFGEPNIRFRLGSSEHKRRELKHLYPMQLSTSKLIGPPLKSCLKKCNSLKQENRKKRRVRFTIET